MTRSVSWTLVSWTLVSTTMTTFGSRQSRRAAACGGVHQVVRSVGIPRSSATNIRRGSAVSAAPSMDGSPPGPVSTATHGWARQALTARSRRRPCALSTRASSHGSPARAKARVTEDVAGSTSMSRRSRRSARTMPKNPGSPLARTTAGPPSAARWALSSDRPAATLPRVIVATPVARSGATASRWRRPPTTTEAVLNAWTAAAVSGRPSQPITVTRFTVTRFMVSTCMARPMSVPSRRRRTSR